MQRDLRRWDRGYCLWGLARQLTVLLLIMISLGSIAALVSGGSFLEIPLPGGLPVGNVLSASALCAAAGAAIGLSHAKTLLRYVANASFVAACAWLPVSVILAGNLALNFSGRRGEVWIVLSLAIAIAVFGSLAWAVVYRTVKRCRHGRSSTATGAGIGRQA